MRNGFLKIAIVFTILAIFLGYTMSELIFLSFKDPVDIYDYGFDIVKHGEGGHIKTEIFASYGDCASETLTTTKNGTVTSSSTDYYYIIPVYDKNDEEYYICIEVDQDDRKLFNNITNETWDYLDGTIDYIGSYTYDFEGTIEELDDELYEYMLEWFREVDAFENETELRAHVLPLCLNSMNFGAAPTYIIILIVVLVLTVFFWILFFVRRSKIKANNAAAMSGTGVSGANLNGMPINNTPQYNNDPYNTQYNNQYNEQYNMGYNNNQYDATQYNNNQTGSSYDSVVVNGVSYPRAALSQVNSYVLTGEKVKAIAAFREISGLGLAESKNIIDNWNQYYN